VLLGALPASAETADGGLGPIPQRSAAQRSQSSSSSDTPVAEVASHHVNT